jgi:hypothetical protein
MTINLLSGRALTALFTSLIGVAAGVAASSGARADVVSATLVAHEGQVVPYNGADVTVGYLNVTHTNGLGMLAFTAESTVPNGDTVWADSGIIWRNSDALPDVLVGSSESMGLSNAGDFIYSVLMNNKSTVYTNHGKLLSSGDPHPILPGLFSASNSAPKMTPGGTAYWMNGYTSVPGAAAEGWMILKCTDISDPDTITAIVQTGDMIGGLPVASAPDGWNCDLSDDETHVMFSTFVEAAPATNDRVVVNGNVVAAAGSPTGDGDNWHEGFESLHINSAGNYIFTAHTTGLGSSNRVLAYNGGIVLREGMVVDGFTLGPILRGAGMNNLGKLAFSWTAPSDDVLFYGDADNATVAQAILRTGDHLDFDNDGKPDALVTDINIHTLTSPGISLSDHDFIFVNVSILATARGEEHTAIVRIDLPSVRDCPADTNSDGEVDVDDLITVILNWGACDKPPAGCLADVDDSGAVDVDDLVAMIVAWGECS